MKKLIRTTLLFPTLFFSLATPRPLHALESGIFPASSLTATSDETAYAEGTRAMNEQRWSDAVSSFDKVIDSKGRRADAAIYWKAYSLNKLGNSGLALATCFQLRSQYTSSRWNKDCNALSIDLHVSLHPGAIPPVPPIPPMPPISPDFTGPDQHNENPNDDLKMLALNSLLNQDPSRAIPLLRGILTGNQSIGLKKHALFVLAQSKSPEAESTLHDAVVGKLDPALQQQAIQSMAIFQGKRANDTLAEVYRTTSNLQIKKSIISAFFITQDAPRMVELARNEKDLKLKRDIVSQLALMHDKTATDYMLELLK